MASGIKGIFSSVLCCRKSSDQEGVLMTSSGEKKVSDSEKEKSAKSPAKWVCIAFTVVGIIAVLVGAGIYFGSHGALSNSLSPWGISGAVAETTSFAIIASGCYVTIVGVIGLIGLHYLQKKKAQDVI